MMARTTAAHRGNHRRRAQCAARAALQQRRKCARLPAVRTRASDQLCSRCLVGCAPGSRRCDTPRL